MVEIAKSARAVFAGVFVVVLLSEGTDYALAALHVYPGNFNAFTDNMLMIATAYRCLYAVLGGYVTAWYSPDRPLLHVFILGVIGLGFAILGAVVQWDLGRHWYPIALAVTALPSVMLGGVLYRAPAP